MKTGDPRERDRVKRHTREPQEWTVAIHLSRTPVMSSLSSLPRTATTLIDLKRDTIVLEMPSIDFDGSTLTPLRAQTVFQILDRRMSHDFFDELQHLAVDLFSFLIFVYSTDPKTWGPFLLRFKNVRILYLTSAGEVHAFQMGRNCVTCDAYRNISKMLEALARQYPSWRKPEVRMVIGHGDATLSTSEMCSSI